MWKEMLCNLVFNNFYWELCFELTFNCSYRSVSLTSGKEQPFLFWQLVLFFPKATGIPWATLRIRYLPSNLILSGPWHYSERKMKFIGICLFFSDTGQKKNLDKKDGRRMSFQKPKGTIEYTVSYLLLKKQLVFIII